MLTYTNHLRRLILPEYGRNIQNMVDYCVTIEDREERNNCAHTIVNAMLTLFPVTGDAEEYRRKLWDHLLIMSEFKLDIDWPYEHVDPTVFDAIPDPVPQERPGAMQYRHYGVHIPRLVEAAAAMEEGEEREALIFMIANQMKKTLLTTTADSVEDARIFSDLRMMSHGAIRVSPDAMELQDYKPAPAQTGKKKKKR
ncbi:MAG: DUF4290 domain-containing protein [Muribaculaceae bacterium]|nr:DUF4290 domain-containing protein [Muribaculaceae bacterium]